MNRLLSPKNDFVFKKLLGEPGSEKLLGKFLEAILKTPIGDLEIRRDLELLKDFKNDKTGIIDVRATLKNGIKVNIEIQLRNEYNIVKRSFFYLSKLYIEGLHEGENYNALNKTIVINILDYKQFENSYSHSTFLMKDENNNTEIFEDVLEMHFIELPKIPKDTQETEPFLNWMRFIRAENEEVFQMLADKNEDLKEAKEKLEYLSSDEKTRLLAESRAKYLSDLKSNMEGARKNGFAIGHEEGLVEGRDEGRNEGRDEGRVEGRIEEKVKTIQKLFDMDMSVEAIAEFVELTKDEVNNLLKK